MKTFRLERQGDVPLEFVGRLLADETSRYNDQPRWTDVRIYRTDSGRYVTESVGRSILNGETDRTVVRVVDHPEQVREALLREPRNGKPYLTSVALVALTTAAEEDPRLQAALIQRI